MWGTARLLAQAPWVLGRVAAALSDEFAFGEVATLDPARWATDEARLLVFEAYVSGTSEVAAGEGSGNPHALDALRAVETFGRALPSLPADTGEVTNRPVEVGDSIAFSSLGAAVLHAGLPHDLNLLRTAPILVRPSASPIAA